MSLLRFIPDDFDPPAGLETGSFRLRMLTIHDVVKDYDAVMSSRSHLRGVFGPGSPWPPDDLSLEQNLIDLGWHQKEFQRRTSFTYTVLSPDESQVLGCVYIYPCLKRGFDAQVILWVRESALPHGLDPSLFQAVQTWLADAWPFREVAFPGRAIDWDEWAGLD